VRFAFEDLPSGVYAFPLVIPSGPSSGIMILSAASDAPLGSFPLRLVATAEIAGKTVTRPVEGLAGDAPVRRTYLSVMGRVPFSVDLVTLDISLEQNQTATLEVLAQRNGGFSGDIKLVAEGFAAGREGISRNFSGGEVVLKAGEVLGKIPLTAKLDSEVGTRTIVVRGEASVEGVTLAQYTLPIPATIYQVPFVISSTLARLSVTALQPGSKSAAAETQTTLKLERRAGFTGEVDLKLEGLPGGIESTLEKIPANVAETTLKLLATDKAVPTNYTIKVTAAGSFNDRTYKSVTGGINLIVAAPEPAVPPGTNQTATAAAPGLGAGR
jgi:hypothetical protein